MYKYYIFVKLEFKKFKVGYPSFKFNKLNNLTNNMSQYTSTSNSTIYKR